MTMSRGMTGRRKGKVQFPFCASDMKGSWNLPEKVENQRSTFGGTYIEFVLGLINQKPDTDKAIFLIWLGNWDNAGIVF